MERLIVRRPFFIFRTGFGSKNPSICHRHSSSEAFAYAQWSSQLCSIEPPSSSSTNPLRMSPRAAISPERPLFGPPGARNEVIAVKKSGADPHHLALMALFTSSNLSGPNFSAQ